MFCSVSFFLVLLSEVFLFGICIGSFLNVVVYRLPNNISIAQGNSFCPQCKNKIKWYDLIPVLSFLFLGGKCRSCKHEISLRYPFLEILTGLAAIFSVVNFGFSLKAFLVFLFIAVLIAIFFIDIDAMIIPDELVLFLICLAIAFSFIFTNVNFVSRCIGFFSVSSLFLVANFFVKDSFGGGDIKLMAVCGYILGWQCNLLAFFISLITASILSIFLLASKRKNFKSHIPFGPHLCFGIVISFFYGHDIINWYLSFFGF